MALFAALGSKHRWPIIELLADGTPRTATDVAAFLKRDFDGVSKHLRLMWLAGAVQAERGEDRRLLFFSIPSEWRRNPGEINFGLATVRLASVKQAPGKD